MNEIHGRNWDLREQHHLPDGGVLSDTKSARWYAVQCKPREEARALENLERQGFNCYSPTLNVEKLRHGRKVKVSESLFPGYLFIHLDEVNDNWYPIRSTRGVLQLVRFSSYPTPVPDKIIDLIRQRLAAGRPSVPYLRPGERVRITNGAFAQFEAFFVANDGEARVLLLMNILQSEQTLSFPVGSIQKARMGY
jgi:transcriptional antiterminator RfaH